MFNSTFRGEVPEDAIGIIFKCTWNITFKLLDLNNNIVAEGVFGIIQINNSTFLPGESMVVITGGGAITIIVNRDSIISNGSVNVDEYGKIQMFVPLPTNTANEEYNIVMIYIGTLDV